MRLSLAVGILVFVALASTGLDPARAAGADRCRTKAKVLRTSPRVELWETRSGENRVCHRLTGRITALFDAPEYTGRDRLDIAGDFLAFAWESPEDDCGYSGVHIVNARTGKLGRADIRECGYATRYKRVVVKRSGRAAWSEPGRISACRDRCAADDGTSNDVLARGRGIDSHTLKDTRRGVSWLQNGRRRYARLR